MKGCLTGGLATLSRFFAILRLSAPVYPPTGGWIKAAPGETRRRLPYFPMKEKAATWSELDVQPSVPM